MSRANGRSVLMVAVGVLLSLAIAAPAAADDLNTPVFVTPAANGTQPNTSAQPAGANQASTSQAADPNQLNDMDRASPANAAAQPSAPAANSDTAANSAPASNAAAAASAGGQHSIWNETSLIGKIFIGFGALLTIASAARMFMA